MPRARAADDQVQILTLHSAKGLEWPMVFLPGWEEEVFPSRRSLDEQGAKGLEEERRLAYVGITRARERCYISFAANRQIYGRWTSVLPSRFVDELPARPRRCRQRDRLCLARRRLLRQRSQIQWDQPAAAGRGRPAATRGPAARLRPSFDNTVRRRRARRL